ncbi:hypothetical protein DIPPA_33343 [Diplonema papillatum]|nr:hypothetical protein DIPPA_33342 [Diplonema papillatum]KAJ9452265.1 hypothetical protein DIPPA_33343 [Diplonema papillatum]
MGDYVEEPSSKANGAAVVMRSVAQSAVEGIRKRLYSESADNSYGDTGVLSHCARCRGRAAERKLRRRRRDDGAWCHVESSQDLARLPLVTALLFV